MSLPGKATALVAGLAAACFAALGVLTKRHLSPDGLDPFDAHLTGYTHGEARGYIAALAETGGTEVYLGLYRQLDTAFPVLLTLTFLGAIWIASRALPMLVRLAFALAPVGYLWADLTENARVADMLRAGDAVDPSMVGSASTFTQIKWSFVGLSVIFLLGLLGYRRLSRKGVRT